MLKRSLAAAVLAAALAASLTPALARSAKSDGDAKPAAAQGDEKAGKTTSPGTTAARERQKTCGAQWRALSAAEKTAQGPKWPQYYSKCNKRLKGEGKA